MDEDTIIKETTTSLSKDVSNITNNDTGWFQLNVPTFSTCALILGHQKKFTLISPPIFNYI